MIIDFHTHILPPQVREDREAYAGKDPAFAAIYSSPKAVIATAEDLIASMNRDGVDVSVVVNYGWSEPGFIRQTNDYILDAAARYRGRIIAFCTVPPTTCEDAVMEAERCARAGARGIGELRPDVQFPRLDDVEGVRPLAETIERLGLILMTHASEPVGHVYPGKGTATPGRLYPFICAFPGIKVVCAHWGGGLPFYALMPEVKKALGNVYFDTAASPFLYRTEIYHKVSEMVGAEKVLLGSDFPLLSQERLINEINAAGLNSEQRALVLGGNARGLLGI